ncbi:hypothetical protein B9N43_10465 [Denitratisoma sp. DHT3]|uniref:TonB-dependent receptor domain-containing protein n=1 Tax=Denitratisoma sp. DHT3 TaxID=1981880 RepID=UPI001198ABC7|nr:TonB-dependent receptor [Denitratisoma sp. DHT3]QDX81638.1 hypothetical protein B9N43_10465 [Denitratisoma sp. DHT3]
MQRHLARSAIAAAILAAFNVQAAEPLADHGTIVVTATRQPTPARDLLNDFSVLTRSDIDKAGPSATLGDLLSRLPGIELSREGGRGANENIFIRGTNAGHALILIDGIRVGSATLGQANLSALPVEQMERIEVVRGPESALYGSDAIGGVVNIFTRGSKESSFSAKAGFGSRGSYAANVAKKSNIGDLNYQVSFGTNGEDGKSNVTNSDSFAYNPDKDGFWKRSAAMRIDYKLSSEAEIGAQYFYSQGQNKFDTSWPSKSYDWKTYSRISGSSAYARFQPAKEWTTSIRFDRSVDESDTVPSQTIGELRDDFRTERKQITWQNDINLPIGRALIAVDHLKEQIVTSSAFSLTERDINSLSLGWDASMEKHRWQANVRRDRNSQYGAKNTYNLGYGYQLTHAWRLATHVGTAFKAPSFNDLYYPNIPFVGSGNPNLRPETSRNRDVAVHYETEVHKASLTVFRNDIKNLISWEETSPGSWFYTPANVGKVRIDGWSLSYQWSIIDGWKLRATWNDQDARDVTTGNRLARRAEKFGTLGLEHETKQWLIGVELQASGDRYDNLANTRLLGGYGLVNVHSSYQLSPEWSAFARVDNLFDKHYELARSSNATFSSLGSTVFIGLRYLTK